MTNLNLLVERLIEAEKNNKIGTLEFTPVDALICFMALSTFHNSGKLPNNFSPVCIDMSSKFHGAMLKFVPECKEILDEITQ